MPEALSGTWSPYTLLIAVAMALSTLVLGVVLLVYAFTGRLRARPRPDEEANLPAPKPYHGAEFLLEEPDDEEIETAPIEPEEPAEPPTEEPPPRKTGLWQLLAAMGCSLPAFAAFGWVDDIYGLMRGFTAGTALALAALAGQVFFTVWFARLQRRL